MNRRQLNPLVLLAVLPLAPLSCKRETPSSESNGSPTIDSLIKQAPAAIAPDPHDPAKAMVQTHCQSCHLLSDPTLLPKKTWVNDILPEMGCYLGMQHVIPPYTKFIEKGQSDDERNNLTAAGLYPPQTMLPQKDWDLIVNWFLSNSPDQPVASTNPSYPPLPPGRFKASFIGPKLPGANTTMLRILPDSHQMLMSDGSDLVLRLLDVEGETIASKLNAGIFVDLVGDQASKTSDLLEIGILTPSDVDKGSILSGKIDASLADFSKLDIPALRRPVSMIKQDLDGDGQAEFVVAEYGNKTGRLSLFSRNEENQWTRKVLNAKSGNRIVKSADMNHDGLDDLVVLRAQESEDVLIYYNRGNLEFSESTALKFPPYWGSNDIELADFNNDGHLDLALANGDNADSSNVLKNFHGVYLFLNDKAGGFKVLQSIPLHGAYGVKAFDQDLDGDLDLAVFSGFPDFDKDQPSVLILEQVEGPRFEVNSVPESNQSRWMVMDVGDLDGDGDDDIVLGSSIPGPSRVPPALIQKAVKLPGSVLLLENLAKP